MMTLNEIWEASGSLASQFRAQVEIQDAVGTMSSAQPHYAEFWEEAKVSVEAGNPLSVSLAAVWPDSLVGAVKAAEESGTMEEVFARVTEAVGIQIELRKTMMKLSYPIGIMVVAVLAFIVVMTFAVPMTTRSLGLKADGNFMTSLAFAMEAFFLNSWVIVVAGVVGAVIFGVKWAQSEEGRKSMMEMGLKLPIVGEGLHLLSFGIWAKYMSLMFSAGIALDRSISLTVGTLPDSRQVGFEAFVRDISTNNYPVSYAANVANFSDDDARHQWPLFIRRAFLVGDKTGRIDDQMNVVAPELIKAGVRRIERGIEVGKVLATAVAGMLISLVLFAVYSPTFSAIRNLH